MTEDEAISKSRQYFLSEDNTYGCAETAYLVLREAFGLPNPADSSPAMAFNGGFAWTGGMCGVIAGSAIAIGQLAASRIEDHKRAKRITRMIFIRLMDELIVAKRPLNCRDIIGRDIWSEEQHSTFIDSGIWRDVCMSQIEYLIHRLYRLTDLRAWEQEVASLEEEN